MDAAMLKQLIETGLPGASVVVEDLRSDGTHFKTTVIYPAFEGKTRLEQHRMVLNTLRGRIGEELHAIQLSTRARAGA